MKRALGVFAALLALSSIGAAQTPDLERAKASFKAGASAYAAGDYLAAIQALDAAYAVSPLPAIAFSLAQAERKQYFVDNQRQHLARAVELFHRYLEQELQGSRREDATLALAQLEPLLGQTHEAGARASAPTARPTRLMIVSDAPGARVSLDGSEAVPSPLIREVTPGTHRARVQASGYFDAERDVTALAGELLLSEVRLRERLAALYVWAPDGADIYVDGVFIGQGGERVHAELASGPHQMSVAMKGKKLVRRQLELKRGEAHAQQVILEPTTQRKVSNVLFIGAGAALGTGVVLSAFAIRSENRAESYLNRARRENVTSADVVSFQASLKERDRYRAASVISIASSFGLFITGLFLHELDVPTVPLAARDDTSSAADTPKARLAFSPVLSGCDFGGSLQVNF